MAASEEEGRAPFHVLHKVPAGDGLYVRAKHAQLVERKPEKAIALFWASLETGDRVDSALKDLAIVLKQQNRPHDAILAVCTFRSRCSESAQDSLDNVLLDLYKSSGRLDDQIALLIRKLRAFQNSQSFNGKRTKTARSQGKKFQISVEQEVARLLGNLGWAYMQQSNYKDAESAYRRALALEVDSNKVCNLGVCLMKQGKVEEAIAVLEGAFLSSNKRANSVTHLKSYERAQELMRQASAMLMLNGSAKTSDRRTSAPSTASLLNEGVHLHSHVKRACDDRSKANGPFEVNFRVESAHVGTTRSQSDQELSPFMSEDVHLHSHVKRACDDRSNATAPSEVNFRVESAHVETTRSQSDQQLSPFTSEDAEVMSGRMAAAYHDRYDDKIAAGDASEDSGESSHLETLNVEEGVHSPLQVAPVLTVPSLNSLWQLQMQARRRLPVFQDITLLGSAAA